MPKIFREHGFMLSLLGVLALAFVVPDLGVTGSPLRPEFTTQLAVFLIFLMQGLGLATDQLTKGLLQWRLHLFVQSWNFLGALLVIGGVALAVRPFVPADVFIGFLYLAVLPTTVSSAIAFTALAKGEPTGAMFNGALSQFVGVVVTPVWCVFLFTGNLGGSEAGSGSDLGAMFQKLFLLIILPMLIGQLVRPFTKAQIKALKPIFKPTSSGLILFIVFCAFARSVANDTWSQTSAAVLLPTFCGVVVAMALMHGAVWLSSGWLGLSAASRITALYTGAQKTLASGVPMATAIFGSAAIAAQGYDLGLALLPLLAYHPAQLFLAALLAPKLAKWVDAKEA